MYMCIVLAYLVSLSAKRQLYELFDYNKTISKLSS